MASLQSLWKEGRDGALSPLEQMRAWALREAQKDLGGEEAVNHQKIADLVICMNAHAVTLLKAPHSGTRSPVCEHSIVEVGRLIGVREHAGETPVRRRPRQSAADR